MSTPYGPLTQTRTVRFQNTADGIARLAITSVQVSRNGNVARAGGPIALTPQ